MKKFKCWYGLNGSFGGARYYEIEEFENEEKAYEYAWELACEEYSHYDGLHGLRSIDEIAEDEELDLDNDEDLQVAEEIYNDEREGWLDYWVEEIKEGN